MHESPLTNNRYSANNSHSFRIIVLVAVVSIQRNGGRPTECSVAVGTWWQWLGSGDAGGSTIVTALPWVNT